MANRTRAEWELIIAGSATSNGLTLSNSSTAAWKLWRDLIITIAMTLEGIVNLFRKEVDNHLATEQHGGLYWYGQISTEFQNGDNLVVTNGIVEYSPVVEAHRIVTHVSVKEVDEFVVLKVAKTVSSNLTALSNLELTAFKSYIEARRLPGTKVSISSNAADTVTVVTDVYYSPLYDPAVVLQAINDALALFSTNFAFNAILFQSALVDVISDVPGVVGMGTINVTVTTGGVTFVLNLQTELFAGYFNFSSNAITLIPQI